MADHDKMRLVHLVRNVMRKLAPRMPNAFLANYLVAAPEFYLAHHRWPRPLSRDSGINDYIFWASAGNRWTGREVDLCDKELAKHYAAQFPDVRVPRTEAVFAVEGIGFSAFTRRIAPFLGLPLVAKTTHGSGDVLFLKQSPDVDALGAFFALARQTYFQTYRESQYETLEKKIIIEEDLRGSGDRAPADYKFHCSRGHVIYCQHDIDRFGDHRRSIIAVPEFEVTAHRVTYPHPDAPVMKPKSWDRMLAFAAQASHDFDYVRVDLYDVEGEAVFGEFTFTPGAAIGDRYAEWDFEQEVLAQVLDRIAQTKRGAAPAEPPTG